MGGDGGDGNRAMEGGGEICGLLDLESLNFGNTFATGATSNMTEAALTLRSFTNTDVTGATSTSTVKRAALIQESPVVSLRYIELPSHYTVILTSKKDTSTEYIHWLVTDIPWSTNPEVSQGVVKLEYEPPNHNGPLLHFVLRLYGQKGTTPSVPKRRRGFQPHKSPAK